MAQQKTVPPLGILLVHPLHTARAGLGLLIEVEPDLEVLAQTATCEEAMSAVRRLRRRSRIVLLVALAVGGDQEPFQAIRAFRDEFPTIPVLACGRAVDEFLVSRALFHGALSVAALLKAFTRDHSGASSPNTASRPWSSGSVKKT